MTTSALYQELLERFAAIEERLEHAEKHFVDTDDLWIGCERCRERMRGF